jgi:acyl-CoA synthetase (AMP-forming)/AMP-acid ligase II
VRSGATAIWESRIGVLTRQGQLVVGDVFRNAARGAPDTPAAILGDRALTFAEVDRRSDAITSWLGAQGIGTGTRVATWTDTCLEIVPAFAALAKVGAAFAPVGASLGDAETAATVAVARPALLLADASHAERAARIGADLGIPVATLDGDLPMRPTEAVPELPGPSERDPHVVFFTSGSTGRPKGVVISHRVSVLRTHPGALLEDRGPMVCPYPLFHMGAWTIALQQWQARAPVVLLREAGGAAICDAVAAHGATRLNCIPGVWRRVLAEDRELPTLRFADTGTSATPLDLLEAVMDAAPAAQVRVFYGSTEAGSVASLTHADIRRKPGSCGQPAPFAEVDVDDGELVVRGPLLFDGYFDDPGATAAALDRGWYRTGDLAEIDADGFLTILGRVGDVIRTGGEAVAPAEIEAHLAKHPLVADVAVVGVPDERWGEVVCAVVVGTGATPDLDALRAHCADALAPYKHPRRLVVVDAIPRTAATGQVQRDLLLETIGGAP